MHKARVSCRHTACPRASRRDRCAATQASSVQTPSSSTAANNLQRIREHTALLEDGALNVLSDAQDAESSAALVNFALLSHVLANTSAFSEFANAIEKGVAAAGADEHKSISREDLEAVALDQALANVAGMIERNVKGRIAIEVDPRLSNNADALERRARALVDLFGERGIEASRLLLQLPGNWAGIQAVKALEADGVQCQVTHVYSFAQAVAAIKARASVLVVNITHVNVWYDKHPGAIRDPQGPRQDAGGGSDVNVGVRTASAVYAYAQQQGGRTKVIVAGLRKQSEALQLSGVDYMIAPAPIVDKLAAQSTLQGYNDGLSAQASESDAADVPRLSAQFVQSFTFRPEETEDVDEAHFDSELGMAGHELLTEKVQDDIDAAMRVSQLVKQVVVARE